MFFELRVSIFAFCFVTETSGAGAILQTTRKSILLANTLGGLTHTPDKATIVNLHLFH